MKSDALLSPTGGRSGSGRLHPWRRPRSRPKRPGMRPPRRAAGRATAAATTTSEGRAEREAAPAAAASPDAAHAAERSLDVALADEALLRDVLARAHDGLASSPARLHLRELAFAQAAHEVPVRQARLGEHVALHRRDRVDAFPHRVERSRHARWTTRGALVARAITIHASKGAATRGQHAPLRAV